VKLFYGWPGRAADPKSGSSTVESRMTAQGMSTRLSA
jgi:hypothetical protein